MVARLPDEDEALDIQGLNSRLMLLISERYEYRSAAATLADIRQDDETIRQLQLARQAKLDRLIQVMRRHKYVQASIVYWQAVKQRMQRHHISVEIAEAMLDAELRGKDTV